VTTAHNLKTTAIVAPSMSGHTPLMVSKFRPEALIVAASPNPQVIRQMQLLWGVKPIYSPYRNNSDEVVDSAIELAKLRGLIHEDDLIVLTAGMAGNRTNNSAHTNAMRVFVVD